MGKIVAGTLVHPNGEPLANTALQFIAKRTEGAGIVRGVSSEIQTDASGVYSVDLQSGIYAVKIERSGSVVPLGDVTIEVGPQSTLNDLLTLGATSVDPVEQAILQLLADCRESATEAANSAASMQGSELAAGNSAAAAADSATDAAASQVAAMASESAAGASQVAAAGDRAQVGSDAAQVALGVAAADEDAQATAADRVQVGLDRVAAADSAVASDVSRVASDASRDKAQLWAEAELEVEPGKYSAKHHSAQAVVEADRSQAQADRAQTLANGLAGGSQHMGAWDASAGSPPSPPVDVSHVYRITVAGSFAGDSYAVGDSAQYDPVGLLWYKIDSSDQVASVNGKQGVVVLIPADVGAASQVHAHPLSEIAAEPADVGKAVIVQPGGGLLPSVLPPSGLNWQVVSAGVIATNKSGWMCNVLGGSLTVTAPVEHKAGDEFTVEDTKSYAGTNTIFVDGNGSDVDGDSEPYEIDVTGASVNFKSNGTSWEAKGSVGVVGQVAPKFNKQPTGQQVYTLPWTPKSKNALCIDLGQQRQSPDAFKLTGNQIDFGEANTLGEFRCWDIAVAAEVNVPAAGSVTEGSLSPDLADKLHDTGWTDYTMLGGSAVSSNYDVPKWRVLHGVFHSIGTWNCSEVSGFKYCEIPEQYATGFARFVFVTNDAASGAAASLHIFGTEHTTQQAGGVLQYHDATASYSSFAFSFPIE